MFPTPSLASTTTAPTAMSKGVGVKTNLLPTIREEILFIHSDLLFYEARYIHLGNLPLGKENGTRGELLN